MGELCEWLTGQHPGLKTFKAFRQGALDRATQYPNHRACYRLLAGLAGDYITRYDAEPVPVEVAEQTYSRLLQITADAEGALTAPAVEQIKALNKLAAASLV